jgi:Tc toxin complex TcA C-terminal TcB-binding domain
MARLKFAENYLSIGINQIAFRAWHQPQSPAEAALAAIEAKLVEAKNHSLARHFQDAIRAYQQARDLIYAQLNPNHTPGSLFEPERPGIFYKSKFFDPLLDLALEWMNILPVHQPLPPVRPRGRVDPFLFLESDQTGLFASSLMTRETLDTVADWRLSRIYAAHGNGAAADFFRSRASETDEHTFGILESQALSDPTSETGPTAHRVRTAVQPVTGAELFVPRAPLPAELTGPRAFFTKVNGRAEQFRWDAGEGPPKDAIRTAVYELRVDRDLAVIAPAHQVVQPAELAVNLPHAYYYVIPLSLAECYHALGDFKKAETYYDFVAAYQFLNLKTEGAYLWQRVATLYLDWGNFLFRNGEVDEAMDRYEKVLTIDGAVPGTPLYTIPALASGADVARTVIANLDALIGGATTAVDLDVNPVTTAVVVEVRQQLLKISGGLDFWGQWHAAVPIWTFEYLQSAAINFTQLAISAERDFIHFQESADRGQLTRQQIEQTVDQADAEVNAAIMQEQAAGAEVAAYAAAVGTARLRAKNAATNAADYANMSWMTIQYQALSMQMQGGEDGDAGELNKLADRLELGAGAVGDEAAMSAAAQLAGARANRAYEVAALQRQSAEMHQAEDQAEAEFVAAVARRDAMRAGVAVARAQAVGARDALAAFDNQFFTPDVWQRMAWSMWRLYQRYLTMAVRTARLMQRAYNFETDQSLRVIKSDYSTEAVKGLLGADVLMADIQSFTYDLITSTVGKPQPLRQTISLAHRYPFAFENQFRKTGVMEFETRIEDFDAYYPGTYAGRIEAVTVDVDGIVPVEGISGSLTNSGISAYRTPSSIMAALGQRGLKYRVQSKETLVLSDYRPREDALLLPDDQRMMRVFQGAGLASTWRLELPKAINDIDYGALIDVRLTFYYRARFDPGLRETVLAELAAQAGQNARTRSLPLRWFYPDAFFRFQDTGELAITLKTSDFRRNETKPALTQVGLVVATDGSVALGNLAVRLSTPTRSPALAKTDPKGVIDSDVEATGWSALVGGPANGEYKLAMTAADNPQLVRDGRLTLTPIINIALVLGYAFTPKEATP